MIPHKNSALVFHNTLFQFLGRIVSSGSTFLISVFVAQRLGVQGFGDFSKIITYVPFFFLITDLGLNASFLRLSPLIKNLTWRDLFGLRLLLSLAAVLTSVFVVLLLPEGVDQGYTREVKQGIILYSLSIFFHGVITTTNAVFQKSLSYQYSAISLVGGSLFSILSIIFLPKTGVFAVMSLLVGVGTSAILSLLFASKIERIAFRFSWDHIKILLKDAAPLALTLVFNLVYFRIDSILLTLTRTTAEVGTYNLAYKFFEFPLLFPILFMNSLFPLLLKQTKRAFQRTVKKAAVILFGLGVGCTILGTALSPLLGLINSDFTVVSPLLQTLSLSFPFFFLSNLVMWILITKRLNQELVAIYGFVMVVNIVCNLLFIPLYGPVAAAVITIVGEGLVLSLGLLAIRRHLRYDQSL